MFLFTFLLLPFVSILPQITTATISGGQETSHEGLKVELITDVLSSKNYPAMSLILDQTLTTLIPAEVIHNTTTVVTIFCPSDTAFFSLKYPQPPLTLLQYHVVPLKLEREALESSLPYESKIDTLLPGHPLVLTTLPGGSRRASINNVKITEWNIYNDGRVIIHGIEEFFDPAFRTLRSPWYDGSSSSKDSDMKGVDSSLSWVNKLILAATMTLMTVCHVTSVLDV